MRLLARSVLGAIVACKGSAYIICVKARDRIYFTSANVTKSGGLPQTTPHNHGSSQLITIRAPCANLLVPSQRPTLHAESHPRGDRAQRSNKRSRAQNPTNRITALGHDAHEHGKDRRLDPTDPERRIRPISLDLGPRSPNRRRAHPSLPTSHPAISRRRRADPPNARDRIPPLSPRDVIMPAFAQPLTSQSTHARRPALVPQLPVRNLRLDGSV